MQFVNILDFMMVMPLGPDFARALGVPASQVGWVGGAYLAAASVSGLGVTRVLDRHDRRTALVACLAGLFLATLAGALATGLATLVLARLLAGAFGGPATAIALAMVSDVVPAERRGRAMGAVMGAFSAASVLGVPAGLELARMAGWRAPFVAVALLGALVAVGARWLLPSMTQHLNGSGPGSRSADNSGGSTSVLRLPGGLLSCVVVAAIHGSWFAIVPNIAAFYQGNLGFPRASFGLLYLVGGIASFFGMRVAGRLTDRHGPPTVAIVATLGVAAVLVGNFMLEWRAVPPMGWFVTMMVAMSARNVAWQTLSSRVPPAPARAGYMSLVSSVQHASAALGAVGGSLLLRGRPDGGLEGMPRVAAFALLCAVGVLPLFSRLQALVRNAVRDG